MFKKFFKKKEEKLPDEAALYLMGCSMLQKGEYHKSIEVFNKLISDYVSCRVGFDNSETSEQDAGVYYNRAIAKEALNDKNSAISDLKKSIQLHNIHQAYFKLADLQSQINGELDLGNLVKAYELGSTDAEASLREYTNYFDII